MTTAAVRKPSTVPARAATGTGRFFDDRFGSSPFIRRTFNKVFPDHWSFLIGEIALYSFIILLLTGTFLTFFFDAASHEVIYNGSYVPLKGVSMSEAYASTIKLSFDVRAGLLFRQIHHWAALLFVASIVVHLCRVFFTGAYRKPRELNWLIGIGLLTLALVEGFAGYSLPDDLLSGTGLRIAHSVLLSLPVIGTWAAYILFGGDFPGDAIIGRLYIVHVLLVPGILLALISAHLGMVWYQKHTQFRGPGKTEHNVVGERFAPHYMAKAGGFFMLVFGVLAALGGLVQINPVWLYGPYNASQVSAGSQPDWYIGFLEGSLRMMPPWELRFGGHTFPFMIFFPGIVLPGIMMTLMALWPFIEARRNRDKSFHNLLDRPRDVPHRTGIGVMALVFYGVLWFNGGNDVIASQFHLSINAITWASRIGCFVLPPLSYVITKRICLALQHREAETLAHGVETGYVERLEHGEFVEVHAPVPALVQAPYRVVDDGTNEPAELAETLANLQTAASEHPGGVATVARPRPVSTVTGARRSGPLGAIAQFLYGPKR